MLRTIRLADPGHKLPLPGQPGHILTGDETVTVDPAHPFWAQLLRDGSVVVIEAPAQPETSKKGR